MPLHEVQDGTQFKMHYEVKPGLLPATTLFIHGNLASNRWWLPAEDVWREQAAAAPGSMICAEFRGCGGSSDPGSPEEVTMSRFADDYISLVRSLKLPPVFLVGHSTGGLIVPMMMAKAPELFTGAILLDPVAATGVKFDPSMIQAFEAMKQDKNLTGQVMGSTIYQNNSDSEFFQNVLVEDAFRAVKAVGHLVLKALDGLDVRPMLKTVKHKTLVLHGEHDLLLPLENSRAYTEVLANSQFQVLKAQGHCMNIENPRGLVQIVNAFLREASAPFVSPATAEVRL